MNTPCIEWPERRDAYGYGVVLPRRDSGLSQTTAHRWVYQNFVGPIPDGMCVLHHCDNPPCVRPDHLWLGTRTENSADMAAKGRAPNARFSPDEVRAIRSDPRGSTTVGRERGVSRKTIMGIRRRRTYAWVE